MNQIGYAVIIRSAYDGILLVQLCDDYDAAVEELQKEYCLDLLEYDNLHIHVDETCDEGENLKTISLTDGNIITYTVEEAYR
jgi:hypothetical protein